MTYGQIITLFNNISVAHKQLNNFGNGRLFEIDGTMKPGLTYPLLWAVPVSSETLENTKNRRFILLVLDQVKKDESNRNNVWSDCEQILDDIIKIIKNESSEYNLVGDPSLTPVTELHGDWVTGWQSEIVIETAFDNNYCDVPALDFVSPEAGSNLSYIVDENGNIVYTLHPGQYYVQPNQMINIITTPYANATGTTFAATDATKIIGVFFNTGRLNETADYTISGNNIVLNVAAANDYITIVEVSS